MTGVAKNHVFPGEADREATGDDYQGFTANLSGLYQLSFLLTRDPEKAERCLVAGFEEYAGENGAFREWAHSWTKRTIIQNAIRVLKPRLAHSDSSSSATGFSYADQRSSGPGGHFALEAILKLADFERFVFVMSVLEHYSEHDCALLLECSVSEIQEARTRAFQELNHSVHRVVL